MSKNYLFWVMILFWILVLFGLSKIIIEFVQAKTDTGISSSESIITEHPEAKLERYKKIKENIDLLVDEMIRRESGGNPKICNLKYGCRAGMGLIGFISSTWNSTVNRIKSGKVVIPEYYSELNNIPEYCLTHVKLPMSKERTEVVFDPICNRMAGTWLLIVDGIRHWNPYSGPYNLAKYDLVGIIGR